VTMNSMYPPQTAAAQPGYGYGAAGAGAGAYARSATTYPPTLYPQAMANGVGGMNMNAMNSMNSMHGVHGMQQYPVHSMYPQNMHSVNGMSGMYPMNGVHAAPQPMNGMYPMGHPQAASMQSMAAPPPRQMGAARMYPPPTRPVPAVPVPSNQYGNTLNQYGNASSSDDTVDSVKTPPKAVAVPIPPSDGSKPKPIGAGKEQFGLCPMFGSAKGCKWGADCFYKHSDPNSVPFCPDFRSPEGCYFGDSCFNRHHTFVFVQRGAPVPQFIPQKTIEPKEED